MVASKSLYCLVAAALFATVASLPTSLDTRTVPDIEDTSSKEQPDVVYGVIYGPHVIYKREPEPTVPDIEDTSSKEQPDVVYGVIYGPHVIYKRDDDEA